MRILYLDDSGKIHPNDPTRFAVLAGFSVDESRWHALSRQIAGAKGKFFPGRGPHEWEVKSTDFLTSNAWKRKKRRDLCDELMNILRKNDCHTYVVYAEKAKNQRNLSAEALVPLQVQRLLIKFHAELDARDTNGTVVCDWSTYQMDHHVSQCVQSMVVSRKLNRLLGGVTYGSSASLAPLQVCDVIAGTFRKSLEGEAHLADLRRQIEVLRYSAPQTMDIDGYAVDSIVRVF